MTKNNQNIRWQKPVGRLFCAGWSDQNKIYGSEDKDGEMLFKVSQKREAGLGLLCNGAFGENLFEFKLLHSEESQSRLRCFWDNLPLMGSLHLNSVMVARIKADKADLTKSATVQFTSVSTTLILQGNAERVLHESCYIKSELGENVVELWEHCLDQRGDQSIGGLNLLDAVKRNKTCIGRFDSPKDCFGNKILTCGVYALVHIYSEIVSPCYIGGINS